jgi:DNA repair protein SbcC/Rad50
MIPVTLTLRNFMCYRDTAEVLDFTGIHLACLSGENGAGKSALLEAITWVLWGRARDRVMDDELIARGATEMEVDFHFILSGQHYRVMRKRALKGKSGQTILDVQVATDPEGESWRALTGGTVRETQEQINGVLKLDYDTFINSAFILQGRADEFTTKSPVERKRILADILGLQQYDRLEERAKEEVRQRAGRMKELEVRIDQIDRELSNRPQYASELEEVEKELFSGGDVLLELREEIGETQRRKQGLEHSKSRLLDLSSRIRRRETDLQEAQVRIAEGRARKTQYESLIDRRGEIERGFRDLQATEVEIERHNDTFRTLNRLQQEEGAWHRQIETEKARLEQEQRHLERQIGELERKLAGRGTANQQLSENLAVLRQLETLQQQHEDTKCSRDALLVKVRTLTSERDACTREGQSIRQKLDMLLDAHASGKEHVGCPLCGTGLTEDALERVRRSYEKDRQEKIKEYEAKKREIEQTNKEVSEIERRIGQELTDLKPLDDYRSRVKKAELTLEQMDRDAETLASLQGELKELKKRLSSEEFAREARRELEAVREEVAGLKYNVEEHDAARDRLAVLKAGRFADEFLRLEDAQRELPQTLVRLELDERNVATLGEEQERDRKEMAELEPQVQMLEEVAAKLANLQREERELAKAVNELSERRGGLRDKLARCDTLQKEKGEHSKEHTTASEEKSVYEELAAAFGKNGIQAMIIENVIPEIEDEANAILDRMSDGRMTVRLVTQRDAKTVKSVIETLDINIADEMGTRAYEMYSGGEAFRVNFAIRIALSKLLARRAGTQLQTLVIDEGFGSQDGQGREKLVGAIRSIQGDFEKILVITHIEELKEEFPVRINIVKTNLGSKIAMSEVA